jgi:thiamine biosynthesis lipoprotein
VRPEEERVASFAVGEPEKDLETLRFSHEAMASVWEVHCVHEDAEYARQAAHAAFDLLDRLEQEQSRFIANSDVARINELAGGESTRVSPRTLECLGIARHLYELTSRCFDVTLGSGWERLELLPESFTVRALENGARLDLGGIGKGYAVDRMAELLLEWDVPHALVHGGFSSVRALESPPDREGWALRLSAPETGDVLARLLARRRAFGASGVRKGEHIRDPRTGRPVRDREAAWVAIDTGSAAEEGHSPAAVADGLSTAFMILEREQVAELVARHPELDAWLVPEPDPGAR